MRSVVRWRSCASSRGLQRAQVDALGKLDFEGVVGERASLNEGRGDRPLKRVDVVQGNPAQRGLGRSEAPWLVRYAAEGRAAPW